MTKLVDSNKSERSSLVRGYVIALCVAVAFFPAVSRARVASAQPRGLAVKADSATLCALVGKMQVITLRYSHDPAAAEPRELQVYGVGYTRKREILLFARQVNGYSKSVEHGADELPGWRNFRTDKIRGMTVNALDSIFEPIQPERSEYRFVSEFVCKNELVR